MGKYHRVTYRDRCHISLYVDMKISKAEIARKLGIHRSTVYREVSRNGSRRGYSTERAQEKAAKRYLRCRKKKKVTASIKAKIVEYLEKGWSPEQIAGRFCLEGYLKISPQTIYRSLYKHRREIKLLRRFGRRGAGRRVQRRAKMRGKLRIGQRPEIVESRSRIGDWERDGMYGASRNQLLILVERKTRLVKLGYMGKGQSDWVQSMTQEILDSLGRPVHTITNGSEFSRGRQSKYPVYYCDPMQPHQRGTVENTIGLLRQYVKRDTDLRSFTSKDLSELENKLNDRPRKCLQFKTPSEVFFNKTVALVL
ncbi:MAG: IS30 family transposase [Bdellovibrionales bacterium]|nr:IS30 family transposase [Bdellovibrionales bacterium]